MRELNDAHLYQRFYANKTSYQISKLEFETNKMYSGKIENVGRMLMSFLKYLYLMGKPRNRCNYNVENMFI